jgi:hypothetical protein
MPPKPPAELTDAQASVWRDVVSSMSASWLVRGGFPILVEYCRHVCRARLLEWQIQGFEAEWSAVPGGLERLDRLLAMGDRETKAAISCARALRLTPHTQLDQRAGARHVLDGERRPMPWDGYIGTETDADATA